MSRIVTATEAKARILSLLDDVAAGDEVIITRHGRPVARLVPAAGPQSLRGRFSHIAVSVADEDDLFSTGAQWNMCDDGTA
jgi:prevent-host-death family protein